MTFDPGPAYSSPSCGHGRTVHGQPARPERDTSISFVVSKPVLCRSGLMISLLCDGGVLWRGELRLRNLRQI